MTTLLQLVSRLPVQTFLVATLGPMFAWGMWAARAVARRYGDGW